MTSSSGTSVSAPRETGRGISLEAVQLYAGYGKVAVVTGIDLSVQPGELVVLLGANGAGKSTTLMTLAGHLAALGGQVLVDGVATSAPLHRRARAGLAYVPEERSVFKSLSARDNIRLARGDFDETLERFPELKKRLHVRGGLLSGGEQQMIALGRALSRHPSVVLADELSLGLAPLVVDRLHSAVRAAADRGAAILLVEQHIRKVLKWADRGYILNRGKIVAAGTASELRRDLPALESSYLH